MPRLFAKAAAIGLLSMITPAGAQDADPAVVFAEYNERVFRPFITDDTPARYLHTSAALDAMATKYGNTPAWAAMRSAAGQFCTLLARYDQAIELTDGGQAAGASEIALPEALTGVDAVRTIAASAAGRRVVIINEAHHVSAHRELVRRLLEPLREQGFTHLACETFNNEEPETVTGAASVARGLGFYSEDPVFSELIRQALELGFGLVPYESTAPYDPEATQAESIATREREQAEALHAFLSANPEARLIVLVGYAHLTETPRASSIGDLCWMACRLRDLSGIDPLTVNQTRFSPRSAATLDSDVYTAAVRATTPKDTVVLQTDGQPWVAAPDQYDLEVLTPRAPRVGSRPGWLFAAGDRRAVRVVIESEVRVVTATRAEETGKVVPADVAYVAPSPQPNAAAVTLALRPGRYRLEAVLANGSVVGLGERVVP